MSAVAEALRLLRDDPVGAIRVVVLRFVDGRAAAVAELQRRLEEADK